MLNRNGYGGIPVKRHMAGDHLIHGDAGRINIAFFIYNTASCLLRRGVMYGSHNIGTDGIGGRGGPRNPKIRHFYFSFFGNNDVLRFDIPMDNMLIMGSLNTCHHLYRNADRLFCGESSLFFNVFL